MDDSYMPFEIKAEKFINMFNITHTVSQIPLPHIQDSQITSRITYVACGYFIH